MVFPLRTSPVFTRACPGPSPGAPDAVPNAARDRMPASKALTSVFFLFIFPYSSS